MHHATRHEWPEHVEFADSVLWANGTAGACWLPHPPDDISEGGRIVRGVKVRYTYRTRVSARNIRLLQREWDGCRWVWNKCVELDRTAKVAGDPRPRSGEMDAMLKTWRAENPWLATLSQNAQQQTIRDLCKARSDAWAIRKRGGRRSDPRFRSKRRSLPTLNFTKSGPFRLRDGKLLLPHDVALRPVWSRDLPANPSSVRVSRDSLGHWQVSFVVACEPEPLPAAGRDVGIDWGVKAVASTTSPAHDLPHPHHGDKAGRALARYQRQMARRKPKPGQRASNGYREAKRRAARQHARIAWRRRDTAYKWAKRIVRDFDRIADENFKPAFMAYNRPLARRAADAAIGQTQQALRWLVVKHEREHKLVPAAYTTMTCSECDARAKHRLLLSQRTFVCESCGHVADRDENAASTVLARAGFDPAGADRIRPEATPCVALAA